MDNYPRMLYGFPALGIDTVALQEGTFDTLIVLDEASHEAAKAEGWHDTNPEAVAAHAQAIAAKAEAVAKVADSLPPTRAELEAKATELSIKFTDKTSDKKLADQIAAALEV